MYKFQNAAVFNTDLHKNLRQNLTQV